MHKNKKIEKEKKQSDKMKILTLFFAFSAALDEMMLMLIKVMIISCRWKQ